MEESARQRRKKEDRGPEVACAKALRCKEAHVAGTMSHSVLAEHGGFRG